MSYLFVVAILIWPIVYVVIIRCFLISNFLFCSSTILTFYRLSPFPIQSRNPFRSTSHLLIFNETLVDIIIIISPHPIHPILNTHPMFVSFANSLRYSLRLISTVVEWPNTVGVSPFYLPFSSHFLSQPSAQVAVDGPLGSSMPATTGNRSTSCTGVSLALQQGDSENYLPVLSKTLVNPADKSQPSDKSEPSSPETYVSCSDSQRMIEGKIRPRKGFSL